LLATPASRDPAPLIILLHGMGSNAADIDRVSDLAERGPAAGAVIATPNALGSPTMWRASGQGPDAAFLDAMITDIEAHTCVDTSRVGIAGFSVGAVLAAAYGCTHQDRISAIVTVEVDAPGPCTKPLPILAFHGTADPIVPYAPPPGAPALGGGTGTESNLAKWAQISNCGDAPVTTEIGSEVTKLEWPHCAGGSEVVLYKVIGGGHDWPGKDPATAVHPSTQQVSATDEALSFLGRHAVPAG
jgi:polyhydroxybutyrate depolymerase